MTTDTPIELLEAQRRIKASQYPLAPQIAHPQPDLTLALSRLKDTLAKTPTVANAQHDAEERRKTTEALRAVWNAPTRHRDRSELDDAAQGWKTAFASLRARLGTGFTSAIVGKRGPGKTQMAVELMREATASSRSAYYCTAMDYFMRIKDAFHTDRKETQAQAQAFFIKPKLLVLDEMNVRSDSAWEDNMLADLLGKRYNALLDTILISNETAQEFARSVGPSIVDRLNETGGIVECNWKSFRA